MYIDDKEFYQMIYSMRSALSDIYGMAEKMYESEDVDERKKLLDAIKGSVMEFPDLQSSEPKDDKIISDVTHLKMMNTRALIIDDNDISNYIMENILQYFGVETDVAVSGYEGIEMFGKNEYDMVFLDYIMPDINGIETARMLRKMENGRNQLIIGLTASTIPEFKEGLNSLGIELILFKPIKQEQIGFILAKELTDKAVFDFTTEI